MAKTPSHARFTPGILGAFLLASSASAALLDDFNSTTLGNNPNTPPWSTVNEGTGTSVDVVEDSSNVFGEGASNRFVRILDEGSGSANFYDDDFSSLATSNVLSFTFDFFEPTRAGTGTSLAVRLGEGTASSTGNVLADLRLNDGQATDQDGNAIGGYSLDSAYKITMIGNTSGSAVNYAGGSIADNTFDVWFGNSLLGNDIAFRNNGSNATIDSLGFFSFSGDNNGEFYIDNVEVFEGAVAIPEPSTAVLAILAALAALLGHRRRT
ncbi:MAG: hypothetical protein PF795_03830 [Kiritimatiellae bacterium]|nr:hypothetical protein [Kiritimatiellia bacterium]